MERTIDEIILDSEYQFLDGLMDVHDYIDSTVLHIWDYSQQKHLFSLTEDKEFGDINLSINLVHYPDMVTETLTKMVTGGYLELTYKNIEPEEILSRIGELIKGHGTNELEEVQD